VWGSSRKGGRLRERRSKGRDEKVIHGLQGGGKTATTLNTFFLSEAPVLLGGGVPEGGVVGGRTSLVVAGEGEPIVVRGVDRVAVSAAKVR
jgi:hypothetical protein